jgi:hypothetical protein
MLDSLGSLGSRELDDMLTLTIHLATGLHKGHLYLARPMPLDGTPVSGELVLSIILKTECLNGRREVSRILSIERTGKVAIANFKGLIKRI